MPTATRTVLFTDLTDFTKKVVVADGQGIQKLLEDYRQFVEPILTKHGGRIIKEIGDAYVVLFDSATEAVHAGKAIIEKVVQGSSLEMKVSCATGDVEEINRDAFGDAVNLAARINSKTPRSEFWFSDSTRICMRQSEIPWEPLGHMDLKGIPGETLAFRVVDATRCWLPTPIKDAIKANTLCRVRRGEPMPALPPDPIVLFEGYQASSPDLEKAINSLPPLDPARLWLSTWLINPIDRHDWIQAGRGLVIGTPQALERAFEEYKRSERRSDSQPNTIIIDLPGSELEFIISGLALPAVPMADVVAGYSYDLLADGWWTNRSDEAVLRVDVSYNTVRMIPLAPGISIDGRGVPTNQPFVLRHGMVLQTPGGAIRFHKIDNAPYIGLLLAPTPFRIGVAQGQVTELGREPQNPGLKLPDRRGQDNIRWCAGPRAAKAKEGGFTLDRALAGRRQASIEVIRNGIKVVSLHARCSTYVCNDSGGLERIDQEAVIKLGDLIVVGTTVVGLRSPQSIGRAGETTDVSASSPGIPID